MKTLLLAALPLCVALSPAVAQRPDTTRIPLRISLLTESANLPSASRVFGRLNPGLAIGTEFYYRQARHHQWFQTASIAGFHHRGLASSLLVSSEAGYRHLRGRFHADIKAGPGYVLNHAAAPIYKQTADGYEKTAGVEHRFALTAGVSAGVRTGPVTPFVAYSAMVQTPFLKANSAFLPQQIFSLGVATRIGGKASK